jgi:Tol biopolymer transport system component
MIGHTRPRCALVTRLMAPVVMLGVLFACGRKPASEPPAQAPSPGPTVSRIATIKNGGGRLDWSATDVIAFDQLGGDQYYDVYTMNPDGTGERCLTCNQRALPNRHIGNPAWHPSGTYIVFQVEKADAPRNPITDYFANPGSGINNDLWVMDRDGSRFWQLTNVPVSVGGVLHPHFSPAGDRLLWSERISIQGSVIGEWALKVADFSVADGTPRISSVRTFQPGQQRNFYESSSFTADGQGILFSGNLEPGQTPLHMDIYLLNLASGALTNLTNTMAQWDEHAQMSPRGNRIVWMSSMGTGGAVDSVHPRTDYWMMRPDGSEKTQITFFNDPGRPEYVGTVGATAADSAWNRDGTKLMGYLILDQTTGASRMVVIDFSSAQAPPDEIVDGPGTEPRPLERPPSGEPIERAGASAPAITAAAADAIPPAAVRLAVDQRSPRILAEWDGTIDRWYADRHLERTGLLGDPLVPGREYERLVQIHDGVVVFGAEITRQRFGRQPVSIFGTMYRNVEVDVVPALTPAAARHVMASHAGVRVDAVEESPRLVVLPREGGYALAYQARVVTRHDIAIEFVDARTGAQLDRFSTRQDGPPAVRGGLPLGAATPAAAEQSSGRSLTYDLRGREEAAFALIAGTGSRAWLESFQPRAGEYDGTSASVEAHARLAAEYMKQRTGADLFAGPDRPILIVHPDEPAAPMRAGLWARGPFDAGRGVLVFPDPVSPTPERIEHAFSLRTVAHALGHAFIARTARLLPRGEAGILNEGVADLVASGAVAFNDRRARVAGTTTRAADDQASGQTLLLRVLANASARAAADGVEARAGLESAFYRALALMLPADATLSMARMATEQAARDLPDGAALERHLSAAWLEAAVP